LNPLMGGLLATGIYMATTQQGPMAVIQGLDGAGIIAAAVLIPFGFSILRALYSLLQNHTCRTPTWIDPKSCEKKYQSILKDCDEVFLGQYQNQVTESIRKIAIDETTTCSPQRKLQLQLANQRKLQLKLANDLEDQALLLYKMRYNSYRP